ncbi:MAG TPA: glycosyltransferase [Puia sp.]|nr:glycosyltransferase [Puia sp.]
MKIIHVIPGFLPDHVAGTEIYCWSLCKYLQGQGIETEVVTPGYGRHERTEYVYDGIKVVKYAEPTVQTRAHIAGLALPEGIVDFREYMRTARPDCVHFHGIYAGIGINIQHIAEVKALGYRTVYTMHLPNHVCATHALVHKGKELCDGIIRPVRCASCTLMNLGKSEMLSDTLAYTGAALKRMGVDPGKWDSSLGTGLGFVHRIHDLKRDLQRLAGLCDKVVLYAKWFREIIVANGFPREKTAYVPPGLSFSGEAGHTVKPLSFYRPGSIKMIFIGRIDPLKGVQLLLEAIKDLPEDRIELSLYGKPIEEKYMRECQAMSGGKKNIHWRGLVAREDLLAVLGQHDMLCLPSAFSEMSPLVIQEAFGAGIPVLASEVYGNAELIRHDDNGLLFPFKSLTGLRHQLQRLIDEKDLLPALKRGVKPPIPFEQVAAQYVDIYNAFVKTPQIQ